MYDERDAGAQTDYGFQGMTPAQLLQ